MQEKEKKRQDAIQKKIKINLMPQKRTEGGGRFIYYNQQF